MSPPATAPLVREISPTLAQVTQPLALGIDHVHCYFVQGASGSWMLVDTGLGHEGAEAFWHEVLAAFSRPVERIVITHFHPDHVGGAGIVSDACGAPVSQGRLDFETCLAVWRDQDPQLVSAYALGHGMPEDEVAVNEASHQALRESVKYVTSPELLEPGDDVDGWEVVLLPGHADGHIALLRGGVLVGGDVLLSRITPQIALFPRSSPDPLGDYLVTLARIVDLAPTLVLPGHEELVTNPIARAVEITEHHVRRLAAAHAGLGEIPRSAYSLSLELFGRNLTPVLRQFAVFETISHLEYLVYRERARRLDVDGMPRYLGAA